ncbi:MAG: hypothetical protein H6Q33_1435 [Deltaproteobacteria bacterium]|nr:hypothetical protein [Deltaproteobacteria bacterium]
MRRSSLEMMAWAGLTACLSAAIFASLDSRVLGLFHDDGLYAVLAKTLVEEGHYRLASLPAEPVQTKYPPVYPALLATVWRVDPDFPRNIIWLKGLNVSFIACTLLGVALLARQALARYRTTASFFLITLVGTNPGIVAFADYTMTDTLFLTLVVWVLVCHGRIAKEPGRGREALLSLLTCAAILTRSVGVCLGAAIVIEYLVSRRLRLAAFHAAVYTAVCAAWYVWGLEYRSPVGTIIAYYQAYEQSAIEVIGSAPALAGAIIAGNARMAAETAWLVLGPAWAFWPVLVPLALVGMWCMARSDQRVSLLFAGTYSAVLLAHPFSPHRYLIPLTPIFYMAVLMGAARVADQLNATVVRPQIRQLPYVAVVTTAVILLVGNSLWFQYRLRPLSQGHVKGWYGIDMGYSWSGFQETFEWIRANTPPDARLGTIFDPMYFLYTGRQAVRPWFHHPETYFYPYGKAKAFVGAPPEVAAELLTLRIDYLVLDPPNGYAEGNAAVALLRDILNLPQISGSLVFRSSDGRHEVYRLIGRHSASGQLRRRTPRTSGRPSTVRATQRRPGDLA